MRPMTPLHTELADFYLSQRISVREFRCPAQSDCDKAAASAGQSLRHGSEAHIGSRYGDPFSIVVVSLSEIIGTEEDRSSQLSDHEEYERNLCGGWAQLNPHLVGTQEILESVLRPSITGREVFRHFALTRAAKCSPVGTSAKSPDACFFHCRQFVIPELDVLMPNLVITQGREARWALEERTERIPDDIVNNLVPAAVAMAHPAHTMLEGLIKQHVRWLHLNSRVAILIMLVHPSARGGQWAYMKNLGPVHVLGWLAQHLVAGLPA